ncbi:hypothetical protein GCM10011404_19260 [Sphingomonas prati]|nr:hypothetical protein GCM10011404_19260 [Sphingomonas prati]
MTLNPADFSEGNTMSVRAITVRNPATLDSLTPADLPDIGAPGRGEIAVRLHASSLNFHDYLVANGTIPVEDGRVPMSDGAGEVTAVGDGVTEFAVGDSVVSTFHTLWAAGPCPVGDFRRVPGDGMDGYGRQAVVVPADWFTLAPKGYSHAEAATLTCAGVTAWRALATDGPLLAGQTVLCRDRVACQSSRCSSPRQWARWWSRPRRRTRSLSG